MTIQYTDGIRDINLKDGVVRIELFTVQFTVNSDALNGQGSDVAVNETVAPSGAISTSVPALLQMYATLDQFVKRLADANVVQITPAGEVPAEAPKKIIAN
jgi:hypothetical protein